MKTPKIIQAIGFSESGKTTFISAFNRVLKEKKFHSLSIKSARRHKYSSTAKDSDMFLESGSDTSSVVFEKTTQILVNQQLDIDSIIKISSSIHELDFVLIEGFNEENYSKVLFWTKELNDFKETVNLKNVDFIFCSKEIYLEYKEEVDKLILKTSAYFENDIDMLIKRILADLD